MSRFLRCFRSVNQWGRLCPNQCAPFALHCMAGRRPLSLQRITSTSLYRQPIQVGPHLTLISLEVEVKKTTNTNTSEDGAVKSSDDVTANSPNQKPVQVHRNIPTWASKITYRMVRVSFDPITQSLVEHELPAINPVPPNATGYKRRSTRPSTSALRRSSAKPTSPFNSFGLRGDLSPVAGSPKPTRTNEEAWAAALKVSYPSPLSRFMLTTTNHYSWWFFRPCLVLPL